MNERRREDDFARGNQGSQAKGHACNTGKLGVVSSGNPVLLAIQPTDSPDRCIYHGYADVQSGWRPTKSDLVAEDWIPVNALGRQDTH